MAGYTPGDKAVFTTCQRHAPGKLARTPLQLVLTFTTPFAHLTADILGPFPRSPRGYKFLLTCVCKASRYPEAILLKSVTAVEVAEGLLMIFSTLGIPESIATDRGGQFSGRLMSGLSEVLKIQAFTTTANHPQTNGVVERFHGTLNPMLKKSLRRKVSWCTGGT